MKFLHFADLHIKLAKFHNEYRQLLKEILKIIDNENPEVVVFVGDLHHNKIVLSGDSVQLATEFLREIANKKPLYIIAGNHDLNLNNSSRLDAISPIVDALQHPNIHYMKTSGDYRIGDSDFSFNVKAISDSDYAQPENQSLINIGLYHGAIKGSETEVGWFVPHGEDISIFNGCDYALLGDLHKYQSLDKQGRFRYCGSTTTQNFGETNDKGVLIWDIKDKQNFEVKQIVIPNPHPYITVELNSDGSIPKKIKIPKKARIRIMTEVDIPLESLHRTIDIIKAKYEPESISFVNKGKKPIVNLSDDDQEEDENLRDPNIQEKHMREYLASYETEVTEEMFQKIFELNRRYNNSINLDDDIERGIRWSLDRLEWDNLYNYDEGNYIDFSKLNGIVGLLAGNRAGKSSAVDAIAYTLFNTSFKNSRKSLNIINQNKERGSGGALLRVGNQSYEISRKSEKYTKKLKGIETQEAKTSVEFSRTIGDCVEPLNGQDRNETDKNIRRIFGTLDDFLLTSFSSQHGALSYINEGSTKRKEILARFLDLQMFEEKFRLAKEDAAGLKANLRRFENKDYVTEIAKAEIRKEDLQKDSWASELLLSQLKKEVEDIKEKLVESRVRLSNYSQTPFIDIDDLREEKEKLQDSTGKLTTEISDLTEEIEQKQKHLEKIQKFLEDFDIREYEGKLSNALNIQKSIDSILTEIDRFESDNNSNQKKTELLKEVPCGPEYSSCKFIRDAYKAVDNLPGIKEKLDKAQENLKKLQDSIDEEDIQKSKEYVEKYKQILEKRSVTQSELMRLTSSKNTKENSFRQKSSRLSVVDSEILRYEESIESQKAMKVLMDDIKVFEKSLGKVEKDQEKADKDYKQQLNDLGSVSQELLSLVQTRDEMLSLRKEYSAYELFMRCMHPNGISYQIIKRKLPSINAEIARVLTNVADFEVFFVDDEDKLELFIKHPSYDPRVIEMGSGAEKSLAAMAIRLALFNVSTLPRSDFMVLDEPAVDLDPESMDAFIRILDLLRGNFRLILLISHLDVLKDCVDMQIPIEKKASGYAHICI